MLKIAVLAWTLGGGLALAQAAGPVPDPQDLTRLKDFAAERVSSNNADPDSNDDSWRPIAGETVTLADLTGPGVVTHIWLTIAANEYAWPRLLRLRVYYDGSATASIDCPVGDFFAVGHGFERPVNSLMIRDGSSGRSRNSYWQMPFARRVRITVTNEGRRRVANLYFHVDWKKVTALPPGTAYLHARYRQALPAAAGHPYEILSVAGRGHYVGTVFSIVQNQPGWFGEGDEHFYVDGATRASIEVLELKIISTMRGVSVCPTACIRVSPSRKGPVSGHACPRIDGTWSIRYRSGVHFDSTSSTRDGPTTPTVPCGPVSRSAPICSAA